MRQKIEIFCPLHPPPICVPTSPESRNWAAPSAPNAPPSHAGYPPRPEFPPAIITLIGQRPRRCWAPPRRNWCIGTRHGYPYFDQFKGILTYENGVKP